MSLGRNSELNFRPDEFDKCEVISSRHLGYERPGEEITIWESLTWKWRIRRKSGRESRGRGKKDVDKPGLFTVGCQGWWRPWKLFSTKKFWNKWGFHLRKEESGWLLKHPNNYLKKHLDAFTEWGRGFCHGSETRLLRRNCKIWPYIWKHFLNSFIEISLIYKELHIFNVYTLVSMNVCNHLW